MKKKIIDPVASIISEQEGNKQHLQHEHTKVLENIINQNIKKSQHVSVIGIMDYTSQRYTQVLFIKIPNAWENRLVC